MASQETSDFDVDVNVKDGRITAVHRKYGHAYRAYWYKEPPHLRNGSCRPNNRAERGYEGFEHEAGNAMRRKLQEDGLIPKR